MRSDGRRPSFPRVRRAASRAPSDGRLGSAFWRLLAASTSSNVADGLLRVALPLLGASLTRDPVLIAGLTSLAFLPWLLFALPAGALVDRMDRRWAMVAGNAVRTLALLVLAATVLTGTASMPVLYAVAFAIGAAETVYDSAVRAMLPQVVRREQLDRGNGLMTVGEEGGQSFVGAPVGAALFALLAASPFLVTAGAYAVSIAVVLSLAGAYRPASPRQRSTVRQDIAEGISWLWRSRFLRGLTLVSATTAGLDAMATAVMVLWALDVLEVGQAGYGLLLTAAGTGAVAGGLVAAPLAARIGRSATLVLGGVVAALSTVGAGLSRNALLAGALLALGAAGVMFWNVLTMSLRQALIPQHLFGRVQGGYRTLVWGAIPLGALLGGVLADLTSVPTVFVTVGLGQLLVAGVLARLLSRNRSSVAEAFADQQEERGRAADARMTMHPDEIRTGPALVARLLARQFPRWADLPITVVPSSGTDHDIFRLGEHLVARLPRIGWATEQAAKEATWLPRLAPHLPLAVPVPVAMGRPGEGYPFDWAVHEWLPGQPANGALRDLEEAAVDLAAFIAALQGIDTGGAPLRAHGGRGAPLAELDDDVRRSISELGNRVDGAAALRSWQRSIAAPAEQGPGVWIHGDLLPGNLLVRDGRLSAVIDFGGLTAGDPACDLQPAWNVFAGPSRRTFLAELHVDEAVRLRGRGWALAQAVVALPYYWYTNPAIVRQALHAVAEVLAERDDEKS